MKAVEHKKVSVICAVDNLTVSGVQHKGVKGKKLDVPENMVGLLRAHKFIETEEGKVNEPVS